MNTIGIDIGGSHITAGLVDLKTKSIILESVTRRRIDTQACLETVLDHWVKVIENAAFFGSDQPLKLGMAMPGPFEYEEGISLMVGQNKYDALYGQNVKQLLADRLGIRKEDILMMNDASCFLKGEVYCGLAQHYTDVIGLTFGTGMGSAKYQSSFTYDAELWCHPFNQGIVEDYLSTRWFVARYQEITGKTVKDVKELSTLVNDDDAAAAVFKEFGRNLGIFLIEFINLENPQLVVLGGNISNSYELFIGNVLKELERCAIKTPVIQTRLGEHAPIIGAASLWADQGVSKLET